MIARWQSVAACIALAFGAQFAHAAGQQPAPAIRIVSLAPHLTELAFSAGAGERIVATVDYSDHPEQARKIARIGDAFRVDLERLVALRPDAVLVWESGTPAQAIERIRALNLPVVSFETYRLEDVAGAVRSIGRLAGTSAIAEPVAMQFERDIRTLREQYRDRPALSVFLQINERPLYTVNGKHIISEVIELCGGRNVFANLTELAPAVGIEAVIAANPQVILSTSDTVPDAAASWRRWRHMEAVRSGNVYTLPSDDIARATMRLAAGAREACRTLDTARERLSTENR
jgi:iron complex transport system substrate-binding protein